MTSPLSKRHKINEPDNIKAENVFPRYWILQGTHPTNKLDKLSVFVIEKGLHGIIGCHPKAVTSLRSGELLIEVDSPSQARSLQRAKNLHIVPIKCSPHKTLNYSKGIVRHERLKQGTVEEIKHALREVAIDAHRFTSLREGKKVPTGPIVLTFNTPEKPANVKLGYLQLPVETYIPNPLRCFKCQRYGHGQNSCRRGTVCSKCAQPGHDDQSCQAVDLKCANCQQEHPASSKVCPVWLQEKKVQKVKAEQNISFPETRRIVESNTPKVQSYAAKVTQNTSSRSISSSRQTRNIACQTDLMPQSHLLDPVYESCGTQSPITESFNLQSPDKPVSENKTYLLNKNIKTKSCETENGNQYILSLHSPYDEIDMVSDNSSTDTFTSLKSEEESPPLTTRRSGPSFKIYNGRKKKR